MENLTAAALVHVAALLNSATVVFARPVPAPVALPSNIAAAMAHVNHEIYLRDLARSEAGLDRVVATALADLCGDCANERVRRDLRQLGR